MAISKELWGKAPDGKEIFLYTLKNASGAYVQLCSVGAGIVSIVVPDKQGKLSDVVIGYKKAEDYFADGPCSGKIPGRYANRIAKGKFTLDGVEYTLPVNNGPNHLHGGPDGFQNQVWDSRIGGDAVEFMYYSEDGEAGYPGNLKVVAHYTWGEDNSLKLIMTAETDKPTVLNLTNHVYFNLDGEAAGPVLNHRLELNASQWLPTDETLIPLGAPEDVAGTPMDFVEAKPIGQEKATTTAISSTALCPASLLRAPICGPKRAAVIWKCSPPSPPCKSIPETGSRAVLWAKPVLTKTTTP